MEQTSPYREPVQTTLEELITNLQDEMEDDDLVVAAVERLVSEGRLRASVEAPLFQAA